MASKEGKYNIKAISTMLGIQPGTLRAWERRYQIIEPIRNQAGHRLYTDEHVAVLQWLLSKVKSGFTIGQAVELYNRGNEVVTADQQQDTPQRLKEDLLRALLTFNESDAHYLLNEAFSLFGVKRVSIDLFGQLIRDVRRLKAEGEITNAHEQFMLTFMKMKVSNVFQGLKVEGRLPKVITACGQSEQNELGIMIFSLFLRRKGFDVIYLGTGIPFTDIKKAIAEVHAEMFFTFCMDERSLAEAIEGLNQLKHSFPGLIIGTGGYVLNEAVRGRLAVFEDNYVGETKKEWESWLHKRLNS